MKNLILLTLTIFCMGQSTTIFAQSSNDSIPVTYKHDVKLMKSFVESYMATISVNYSNLNDYTNLSSYRSFDDAVWKYEENYGVLYPDGTTGDITEHNAFTKIVTKKNYKQNNELIDQLILCYSYVVKRSLFQLQKLSSVDLSHESTAINNLRYRCYFLAECYKATGNRTESKKIMTMIKDLKKLEKTFETLYSLHGSM